MAYARALRSFWFRYSRSRISQLGLVVFVVIAFVAVLADSISPYPPLKTGLAPGLFPPNDSFPMGTDQIGRDILSGVIHGARVALYVGILSTALSLLVAVILGTISGYVGGLADDVIMRIVEVLLSIPTFVFAIVIVALYGATIPNIVLVIGLLSWPTLARIVRSEILSQREREYVLAARSLGARPLDLMFDEILPNAFPPIIPAAALQISNAILIEAGLSFLGLSDPNVVSWGKMLFLAQQAFYAGAWWPITFPGIFILMTVLSVNLISDGLNDALNPKLK